MSDQAKYTSRYGGGCFRRLHTRIRRRKALADIQREAEDDQASNAEKFGLVDLLCIGIGGTVGSGVFVLSGQVLPDTGPSATLSWVIAGIVCSLSACSYIELSQRIPTTGSCYTYSFHALGELFGVIGAICLTLEYGIAGAGVARSWSALFAELVGGSSYMFIWYSGADKNDKQSDYYVDVPAGLLMTVCVIVVISGTKVGKVVINLFTLVKVLTISFLIVAGLAAWDHHIFASVDIFLPKGGAGAMSGASKLFFGFIGFDEVCCLAGRSKNPVVIVPRALVGTLLCAATISILAQFALCTMLPVDRALEATSWPKAFNDHGWKVAAVAANLAEVFLLPLVTLLGFLPQPELLGALALDGIIPAIFAHKDASGTYMRGSIISGSICIAMATFVPFVLLWDMVSLGVLLSFNFTNMCLIMVRSGIEADTGPQYNRLLRLVCALLVFGACASYPLWQGVIVPVMDGKSLNIGSLLLGIIGIGASIAIMATIHKVCNGFPRGFTPLMPFIPGLAVILNYMMMATFSWNSHFYFLLFIVMCLLFYFGFSLLSSRSLESQDYCTDHAEDGADDNAFAIRPSM